MSKPALHHPNIFRPTLIEQSMLGAVAVALVVLLSLPATRSASETFGWVPFWLLALPLSAWATAALLRWRRPAAPRPVARVFALGGATNTKRRRMPARTTGFSRAA